MGGRPRVLLVVEQLRRPVPGGIGTYAAGLLQGLDALPDGPDVTLLASRPPRGGDPLARFGRPVAASPLPGRLLTRAWDYALVPAPAGFGVVHAVSLATPLPRRPGETRLVVTVHDLAWRQHPETTTGRGRRWHEAALGRVLRQADAFVVPSAAVAADLTEAGARAERISVITEGADHLAAPDAPAAARRLAAAGVSGPYLLSVGTREPRKNLTRLVEAHRRAASRYPAPWPLVLVGPQGWGGDAAAQGGAAGVVGLGPVPPAELAALYAGAELVAYVPLAEGYGLPPLEAMASGVPVVVSDRVPSVTEATVPAARLVDPTDPGAIAEGLVEVATDDDLRRRLVAAGSTLAAARTWRAAAAAHVEVWSR